MKKTIIAIFLIFFFSALASLPMLKPGLYQMHDDQQIARLFLFDQALKTGQFPVRWVDGLGFGFGYPLFVFYPPLVYIIGEVYHLLGIGFIDSVKLVFFTSIFASGIAMYVLGRQFLGRLGALTSSVFYIFLPYRALDVYVRGALAESFSFVWLPLILWSFYKLNTTCRQIYVYLSGIFLAFLMITHNLIFLPFMLILPIFIAFLIFKSPNKNLSLIQRKALLISYLLSLILALGLSAFFWMPALLEKKFTIVDDLLLVNLANYNIHFVYPQQLWNWTWGFGGSAEGLADGISFKIGKLHVLVSLAALLLSGIILIKNKTQNILPVVFFLLFALSAFMTTFYSKPIWDLISPLGYLQFPWRFLIFTGLFASILAGYFIRLLKLPIFKLTAAVILIALILWTNLKLFKPQSYRFDLTDEIATSSQAVNWDVSSSSFEYVPRGLPLKTSGLGTNVIDIQKSDIPSRKIAADSRKVAILNESVKPHEISFEAQANQASQLTINTFNFPGWQAQIDGKKIPITDNNKFKLIEIFAPYGKHNFKIEFEDTLPRKAGDFITLASMIFAAVFFTNRWRKIF